VIVKPDERYSEVSRQTVVFRIVVAFAVVVVDNRP
jgi:hypothetical protein